MSSREHNNVVVGIDGSDTASTALREAAKIAAQRELRLDIIHALDFAPYGFGGPYIDAGGVYEWVEEAGKAVLGDAEKFAAEVAPTVTVHTEMAIGSPTQWLLESSAKARLVVVGASSSGKAATAVLGNTAVGVASHGKCPVIVVRERDGVVPSDGPVVVGVDGSALSAQAVGAAFEEAAFRGAELVAVHVWSDLGTAAFEDPRAAALAPASLEEEEHAVLSENLAGWSEKYPDVVVRREIYLDNPRGRLLEWSARAQLVVVGSRGRGGFRGMLLGSTSNTLIASAQCPVMVVRPEDS
ncbi:universal stress protein [Rhodococcus sp. ACPA4]|jgi:nucleotide-binding universal stress UspA family protein|uniref:Nucleotide-binding universal stress UspA family protein n=2 Tax=Nocardiaceae TaxID=85025 RepID=A0A652YT60_NOCGL|nr:MULTISPECIES: universal stress protein [Rhodococcus]NMD61169.1 universal stress protein [Nocardia globerula]KJF21298.1 Universal stress protein [Rhodococcus sp. AD45]MCE4264897.1 universal stress protein [Rhodococcus globerulus]MDV6266106.1 universal stress protein [Rhodococcus globerulus]NRI64960.1 universal stress protein [Rhodococcus sp. MS16]